MTIPNNEKDIFPKSYKISQLIIKKAMTNENFNFGHRITTEGRRLFDSTVGTLETHTL